MGLDVSHGCWHGAYSAFSRWRNKLAEVAGYTFHKEGTPPIYDVPDIDWGNVHKVIGNDLLGKWPAIPVRSDGTPDPLIVLLAHPDDEGEIQVEMLVPLANRLEELLPRLKGQEGGGHVGNYIEKTQMFINGLRAAAVFGEPVNFH